ncbi:MAG: redoxin domain-containing protein [Flavobacteriales bacterium]|nr:redoxin domain-containing protein [Flavobacteriales bacterium]
MVSKNSLYTLFVSSLALFYLCSCKEHGKESEFVLETLKGEKVELNKKVNARGYIYVFLLPDCPLSQFYSLSINSTFNIFKEREYHFYGIVPGELYTVAEIDSFDDRYHFGPEIVMDRDHKLTDLFGIKVVPQVVFTDPLGRVLYQGKIDDQAVVTGIKKVTPRDHYLLNAIKQYDVNKKISIPKTEAVGCFIEEN